MAAEATRTTLQVIDQALFSGQTEMPFEETADHVRAFLAGAAEVRLGLLLGLEALDGGPTQQRARAARRVMIDRMWAFINRRADEPEPPEDFIARLYRAEGAEVAIAGRRGFERRYALAEQVIRHDVLASPVPRDDAIRELVRRAARAYGVATAADVADYWRIADRKAVTAALGELVDAGELHPVTVEGWSSGGRPAKAWLHADAVIPRRIDAAAILTPFDPVVWFRDRAERLFDFEYRIEIYTPAAQRRYGYYSLPVLIGDDLVGRVDLKADRAASTLRVQSAWWERSRPPDAADRLADELRLAARWQGLESISVARWGDAADDVADALPEATRVEGGRAAAALSVTDARDEAADVEAELDVEAIAG